jgi:hypothetical protein
VVLGVGMDGQEWWSGEGMGVGSRGWSGQGAGDGSGDRCGWLTDVAWSSGGERRASAEGGVAHYI